MKKIIALVDNGYVQVNMQEPDKVQQYITDSMANTMALSINYENSGWRTIQPYGWYVSHNNDLLVFCYKNNGDIRSYRFDKIQGISVDDRLVHPQNYNNSDNVNNDKNVYNIPTLPPEQEIEILQNSENEQGTQTPFDDAIDVLQEAVNSNTNYVKEYNNGEISHDEIGEDKISKNTDEDTFGDDNLSGLNHIFDDNSSDGNITDDEPTDFVNDTADNVTEVGNEETDALENENAETSNDKVNFTLDDARESEDNNGR